MRAVVISLALAGLALAGQRTRVGPIRPTFLTSGLEPSQGPIAGGTVVTISGSALAGSTVTIDGLPVTPVAQTDTSVVLTMAPHDNGYVVIAVRALGGTTAYYRYLYIPPRLDEIPAGYITTVAGVGTFKGDFGPALDAMIDAIGLAFDRQGNLYLAEANFNEVSRIRPDGIIERAAGSGTAPNAKSPCCGDGGAAPQAVIGFPRSVAVDGAGNFYFGEDDARVRRVDARSGVITTIAGTGTAGFSGDGGPGVTARVTQVPRVAVGDTSVFFLDFGNARVRRVGDDGRISTVAGNGTRGFSGDGGPATAASLDLNADSDSTGLCIDPSGNLFLIEDPGERIRRIDARTGVISTFTTYHSNSHAEALAADRDGNIYLGVNSTIQKFSPSGTAVRSWGVLPSDFSPDGTPLEQVHFGPIKGMTFDAAGNLVLSDGVGRVRRLNFAANAIETIGGSAPVTIGEEGPASGAALTIASGDVALTRSGELVIGDFRVRKVDRFGTITTIAGHALPTASQSNKNNVPALTLWNAATALFVGPTDEIDTVSFSSAPYLIDSRGIARMIASGARCGSLGDGGNALSASMCEPWDVARDRDGNIFFADTNNNRIRRVDARTNIITTVVGTGPTNGFENYYPGKGTFCGDGGLAVNACLATPASIAFDPDGNLFVSDTVNRRIRRVDRASGIITTFVTLPTSAMTIRFDKDGYLYTNLRDRIVRFDRNGRLQTVAGTEGATGFSGDGGPALQATIDMGYAQSSGIAVNDAGDVFFVDAGNRRVRAVKSGALLAR